MKNLNYLLITIVALSLSATSCKKDKDEPTPTPAPTKTQLLTAKNWELKIMTVNNINLLPFLDACAKDDITLYRANGTIVYDEGVIKCDSTAPQTTNGTWKFISNETKMIIDNKDTATVEKLTSDSLILKAVVMEDGKLNTLRSTFVGKK